MGSDVRERKKDTLNHIFSKERVFENRVVMHGATLNEPLFIGVSVLALNTVVPDEAGDDNLVSVTVHVVRTVVPDINSVLLIYRNKISIVTF